MIGHHISSEEGYAGFTMADLLELLDKLTDLQFGYLIRHYYELNNATSSSTK
ncbi:hypothetical protein [Paenibacillus polymyxa]|uniref:hypothetical protein n=1 Tax=Paenibacillus polymyxa TaxID=1406 RepID=UPI002AB3BD62|nr:hypothetical protein [Paenibacillus polymyxa]MDY8023000.1 hypothetical protein [Paenibacillus polymyxa]